MLSPLFIVEVIANLGLGEQLFAAVILLFLAFEATRILKVGRRAGGFIGGAAWYGIVISVTLAGAILVGWIDPNPGAFMTDVVSWGGSLVSWVSDKIVPRVSI